MKLWCVCWREQEQGWGPGCRVKRGGGDQPVLTLLQVPAYQAVGIALASDVLASAVSAYTYGKSLHLDIKTAWLCWCQFWYSLRLAALLPLWCPNTTMRNFSRVYDYTPGRKVYCQTCGDNQGNWPQERKTKIINRFLWDCNRVYLRFIGAGGGMMMLLLLTSVLGYELKTAVGNQCFCDGFHSADRGGISHMMIGGLPDFTAALCVFFTLVFARIGARFANRVEPKLLNPDRRYSGRLGVAMFVISLF